MTVHSTDNRATMRHDELMSTVAEFTIEPFVEGDPGPHVSAAVAVAEAAGLAVDVGPFGPPSRVGRLTCWTPWTPWSGLQWPTVPPGSACS